MSDDPEDRALNNAAEWMRHSFPNSPIFQNRTMSLKAMLMRFYDYGLADGKSERDAAVARAEAMRANQRTPGDGAESIKIAFADQSPEIINRIVMFTRFRDRTLPIRTHGYLETCGVLVGLDKDEFCGVHPGESCPHDNPEDCPIRRAARVVEEG